MSPFSTSDAVLLARLGLAAVFLLAGALKALDLPQSRRAIAAFGVPARVSQLIGTILPAVEIAIGISLLFPGTLAVGAAISAFALLAVFAVAIGVNLASGRKPECNCFGQVGSRPISSVTLVRNALFAAVAMFVLWMGPQQSLAIPRTVLTFTAVAGCIATQWIFLWQLFRQNGRLLMRIEQLERQIVPAPAGLPVGAPAPMFEGITEAGGDTSVLIFTDPNCPPCQALLPDIPSWQSQHRDVRITVVTGRTDVATAYAVSGTPAAVLVRTDGTIGSSVVFGREAIAALIASHSSASGAQPHIESSGRGELTYGIAAR